MPYVKICPDPRCAYPNDESAGSCASCNRLLGNVVPTLLPETEPSVESASNPGPAPLPDYDLESPDASHSQATDLPPRSHAIKKTKGVGNDILHLEFIRGGRVFAIHPGQILGRDDGSADPARVNIPDDAGVDVSYVSRWHCRFDFELGCWSVTPLDPREFMSELKKANPTFVGNQELTVGQSYPVRDGDRLTLSDVELRIRLN